MSTAEFESVDVLESEITTPAAAASTELEARNVSVWFGQRKVLEGVNMSFPKNSVTALIGPSGCGKSTFIRTLNRLHELLPGAALALMIFVASLFTLARVLSRGRLGR